jgi:hypothetical protein
MSIAPQGDAFALKNSGLNVFLFAEVGTEQNGSPLTVLSTLARLGKDPWAQAAEWAKMPAAATVPRLTQSIIQMPLCPRALAEAGATSARLIMLLPRQTGATMQTASRTVIEFRMPEWLPRAVLGVILGLAVVAGAFVAAPTTPVTPPTPVEQTIGSER